MGRSRHGSCQVPGQAQASMPGGGSPPAPPHRGAPHPRMPLSSSSLARLSSAMISA